MNVWRRAFWAPVLIVALAGGLGGCAADADGPAHVELEGRIIEVTASAGDPAYVIEVADEGLLPLELPDTRPPAAARGVVVEVPDGLAVPDDASGRFDALVGWVAESGESLVVLDYLT